MSFMIIDDKFYGSCGPMIEGVSLKDMLGKPLTVDHGVEVGTIKHVWLDTNGIINISGVFYNTPEANAAKLLLTNKK